LGDLWRFNAELFASDAVDEAAVLSGLGPRWGDLKDEWFGEMSQILAAAQLEAPASTPFLSTGKQGTHSEHMGFILAELQYLQRAYPGGTW